MIAPAPFTPALNDKVPFKVVVRHRRVTDDGGQLGIGDRLWLPSDSLGIPSEVPGAVLAELVAVVRAGNKVGLAARDEAVGSFVRDVPLLYARQRRGIGVKFVHGSPEDGRRLEGRLARPATRRRPGPARPAATVPVDRPIQVSQTVGATIDVRRLRTGPRCRSRSQTEAFHL